MTRYTHHALAALIGTALLSGAALAADSKVDAQGSASASSDLAERVERRAAHLSSKAQAETQAKLDAVARKVDAAAAKTGDAKLSTRLAGELGTSAQALLEERADASWGSLVIAHRLAANAGDDVTATQLLDLHEDGMGWGTIAAGLGFSASQAVQAATTAAVNASAAGAVNAATSASVGAATANVGVGGGLGLGLGR